MKQLINFYKEYKVVFFFAPLILALFFLLRLYGLTIIPVFADEAIYIRWAQVMRAEPTLRFLPLFDGKQPLFMWLVIPFLKLISDPLVAGRMVSVFGGLGTLVGIFLLTLSLIRKASVALIAALLYAIVPFAVFFDRMALADSLLSCFGVWILYSGVLLVQYQRLDFAMITGMVLGGAFLTKSPAQFFAVLLPTAYLLRISFSKKIKQICLISLIKQVALWLVIYFFAFGIFNILRLGPNFQMIALRNKDYVFPLNHILTNPFDPFQFHLKEIWEWLGALLSWPIFLISFFGILIGFRKYRRETVLLLVWLLIPLLVQAEYAKVFTARYIFFSVPLVLVFSAIGLFAIYEFLSRRVVHHILIYDALMSVLLLGTFAVGALKLDYQFLANPQAAPLPRRERSGYLEEWTSGYGIKEVANYLREKSKSQKILVGTEGYFGTLPDGLQIYLEKAPNITILGVGYPISKISEKLENSLIDSRVFLLANSSRIILAGDELERVKLIASYPKAIKPNGEQEKLLFYEVLR